MPSLARLRSIVAVALQITVLALLALAFAFRAPQVSGPSMEPAIAPGEFVLINTLTYRLGPVARGDIIAFRHAAPLPAVYLKRVIGLPGDEISIEHGKVQVNGKHLAEPYVRFSDDRSYPTATVPPQAFYVLGDNRVSSDDSRAWGFVSREDVVGKAVFVLWPPGQLGKL